MRIKWFQHQSDSHTNLKMREFLEVCGMTGYGVFWLAMEFIAQQGEDFRIPASKRWKKFLSLMSKLPEVEIDKIMEEAAEVNLIDKKALNEGDLFVPNMEKYADDYSKRVKRVRTPSEQYPNSVRADEIRRDKIRSSSAKKDDEEIFKKEEIKKLASEFNRTLDEVRLQIASVSPEEWQKKKNPLAYLRKMVTNNLGIKEKEIPLDPNYGQNFETVNF